MRKIDYLTVCVCAFAAFLCGIGSNFSAPCFIVSSSIGLADSIKHKALAGSLINSIFLILNLYNTIRTFF